MLRFNVHSPLNWRRWLLIALTIGWLSGIILASWLNLSQFVFLAASCTLLVVCAAFWSKPGIRYAALILLCFCLGAWRYGMASTATNPQAINAFIGSRTVEIQGTITAEPDLENNSTLLTINAQSISPDKGQNWQTTAGELQVEILGATFDDPYGPHYGDDVQLTGKLSAPPASSSPELLASMAFPALEIGAQEGNPLLTLLYQWRTDLAGILLQALPQPFAALLIALFLSLRTAALKPLIPLFNQTGTAHLIAPSGFKVTLFAGLINSGTRWLVPPEPQPYATMLPAQRRQGNWRRGLRSGLIVLCIITYTFLSGGEPAALRAGIMGTLLIIAPRLERSYNVYTALALTALVMSVMDPFVLWDVGFELSVTGTLGIVVLTPFCARSLAFLQNLPLGPYIAEIIAVTLAAQIATWPITALSFNEISFVAPLANLISVPLLGLLLITGALICLGGLLAVQLALISGWLAWPLLWSLAKAVSWCASLPGAYLPVNNLSPVIIWSYYALLIWIAILLVTRWPSAAGSKHPHHTPLVSPRGRNIALGSIALIIMLTTGTATWITHSDGQLTLTLLSTGNPSQGEALFLRTPDGQTALIDEGASSTILAQTLDTRLPFWERDLSLIMLTDTSAANLSGVQDIINRYQVARIVDGGMLHPSLSYARWRSTLSERDLSYTQARQGMQFALGKNVTFQVLWPPAQLHKSSSEEHDNALIFRLLAPDFSMLLLNATSLSDYALKTLETTVPASYLQTKIVQITGENGKVFPSSLSSLLALAHPSLLLIMPAPARTSKSQATTAETVSSKPPAGSWQMLYTSQASNLEIDSSSQGWHLS